MNLNKLLKKLRLPFLILFIFYACTSEQDYVEDKKQVEPLTVESASLLYKKYIGNSACLKSGQDNTLHMTPNWETGQLFNYPGWDVVESPLEFEGNTRFAMMTDKVSEHVEQQGDNIDESGQLLRLLMFRNSENGKTYTFIMQIIPDLDYLQKGHEKVAHNRFMERESDLDGFVMFYTIDGSFVNGWRYKNGLIVGEIPKEEGTDIPQTKSLTYTTVCEGYTEYFIEDGVLYKGVGIICYRNYTDTGITVREPTDPGNIKNLEPGDFDGFSGGREIEKDNKDKDKKPEDRDDCGGKATENANNAKKAMDSPDVLTSLNALREYAKNKGNEWGLRIDFVDGKYKAYALHEGGPGSVSMYLYYDTEYDAHSHPEDTKGYNNLTGFSMADVYGTLSTGGDPKYANYKGSIVIAYDGSEYLLAVNDRTKLQYFWKNDANKKLFESGSSSGAYFKDSKMNADYVRIREQLEKGGYSENNAHDYTMSYLLDKYDTGLKISKKEKGESSFKEMKTEENTTTNDYKPTKCP